MSIETRLQRARLGIAAATAGLGMILGGCAGDPVVGASTSGQKQLNNVLGIVMTASGNPAVALGGMAIQHENQRQHELEVAETGRTEVNVYGSQQSNVQPISSSAQPMYAVQPRFINAYKTRDLNGNGVGEFMEELISANGEFRDDDLITVRASNRNLPGTTIKLRIETNDPINGWQILGETGYVPLPANEEQYWGYPARDLGTGNKRAIIYEARMGSDDIPIGMTYFNVKNSEGTVTKLNGNAISSMEARKNTL